MRSREMTKRRIEAMCRNAGMRPESRTNIGGAEVFIADGFSAPPHFNYWRMGVEPTDFPFGMYATMWWASKGDEKLDIGQPMFFDAFHNPEFSKDDKRRARVNAAMKEAQSFLQKRKKEMLNG